MFHYVSMIFINEALLFKNIQQVIVNLNFVV